MLFWKVKKEAEVREADSIVLLLGQMRDEQCKFGELFCLVKKGIEN